MVLSFLELYFSFKNYTFPLKKNPQVPVNAFSLEKISNHPQWIPTSPHSLRLSTPLISFTRLNATGKMRWTVFFIFPISKVFFPALGTPRCPLLRGQDAVTSGRRRVYCGSSCQREREVDSHPLHAAVHTGRKRKWKQSSEARHHGRGAQEHGVNDPISENSLKAGMLLTEIPSLTWH